MDISPEAIAIRDELLRLAEMETTSARSHDPAGAARAEAYRHAARLVMEMGMLPPREVLRLQDEIASLEDENDELKVRVNDLEDEVQDLDDKLYNLKQKKKKQ